MSNFKILVILLLAGFCSCNKENQDTNVDPDNTSNNVNYKFDCPSQNNSKCILDQPFLSYIVVNSGIHPLATKVNIQKTSSSTGTIKYTSPANKFTGSGIEFRYGYEIGSNCSEMVLRNFESKILRNISFIVNDSFIIMNDPILCPEGGCFLVNEKYLKNYLKSGSKNTCNMIERFPFIQVCDCGIKKSGNNCKSEHQSYEINDIDLIGCTYTTKNNNYILNAYSNINTSHKTVLEIIKTNKTEMVWRTDISSYFQNSPFGIFDYDDSNENFIELPNGNILFGSIRQNTGTSSSVVLLELDQNSGNIVKQKQYPVNSGVVQIGTKILKMANNEFIMEIPELDLFAIFNSNLDLIVIKKRATLNNQSLYNVQNNTYTDGVNVYKIYYNIESGNRYKMPIYKYDKRMEFVGISIFDPEPILKFGDESFFYKKTIELSDNTLILINETSNNGESGFEWHRIKPDGQLISKGIILDRRYNLESINAIIENNNIYFAFSALEAISVVKSNASTGKTDYIFRFTPETSFEVEYIKEIYREDGFISILALGTHSRFNILKFKFSEESIYKYDSCK